MRTQEEKRIAKAEANRKYNLEHHEEILAYQRKWRAEHRKEQLAKGRQRYQGSREEMQAKDRASYQKHRVSRVAKARNYRKEHPEKVLASQQKSYVKHRGKKLAGMHRWRARLRLDVLQHYGGAICVCCGEKSSEFLTVDHISGGGNAHRRSLGRKSSGQFYKWLKDNNWPAGFRVLCMNCNSSISWWGYCPHNKGVVTLRDESAVQRTNGDNVSQLSLFGRGG